MVVRREGGDEDEVIEATSLWHDDNDTDEGRGGRDTAECLRSGLQAAVFLSPGGGTVGVALVSGLAGRRAKEANSEGGGVERSKAGDNKDELANDVSGEIEGGIGVMKEDSKYWFVLIDDFVDEIVVGSK
jgi:hypothetical protein